MTICEPSHGSDTRSRHTARRLKRYGEDCMPGTKKNVVLYSTKPTTLPIQASESGWDPFEVWRTRVLQPRLAEARDEKAQAPPAIVPLPRR